MALTIILIGVSSQAMGNETAHHWGYEGGTGPLHWGEIEQDHEKHLMCREGIHQSPINIQDVLGFEKKVPLINSVVQEKILSKQLIRF